MDFPLQLIPSDDPNAAGVGSNTEFVYGMDELRNDLYLLLKEVKGSFLQNISLGTEAVPHMVEDIYVESAVLRCCSQIKGVTAQTVTIKDGRLYIKVSYKGDIKEFDFSIQSL